ncbi:MAG: M48 family metalloprotease [Deltaproteobacteria bacterium]|nr:MAG: M48 family metalloprotease [Deltaproteobacteria bacterium]
MEIPIHRIPSWIFSPPSAFFPSCEMGVSGGWVSAMVKPVDRPPSLPDSSGSSTRVSLPNPPSQIEPINFLKKGFVVTGGVKKISPAHQNNLRYHLHLAHAQDKLRLPEPGSDLQEVFGRLLAVLGKKADDLQIYVMKDDEPNAYWMRGTNAIFVTTGLLQKPNLTKGELSRVLGHELAHYLLYKPNQKIPERFKNPLFRDLFQQTQAAQRQSEEYGADAMGLMIADAAGYSVDEGLEMDRWLAKISGAKKSGVSHSSRVLSFGESHPYSTYRVKETERILRDPCFVWKSRGSTPEAYTDSAAAFRKPSWKVGELSKTADPLDIKILEKISQNLEVDYLYMKEVNIVYDLAKFVSKKTLRRDQDTQRALGYFKKRSEAGDQIARAYVAALVTKLYWDSVGTKSGAARACLEWLDKECGFSNDEVMLNVLGYLRSYNEGFNRYDIDGLPVTNSENAFPSVKFERLVSAFPSSPLRDRLIGEVLRLPEILEDRDKFISYGGSTATDDYDRVELPLNEYHLSVEKSDRQILLHLLYGASILEPDFCMDEGMGLLEDDDNTECKDINLTGNHYFTYFLTSIAEGWPYELSKLEANLADNRSIAGYYGKIGVGSIDQKNILESYHFFKAASEKYSDPVVYKRILVAGRLIALRYFETLPVSEWLDEAIDLIESWPPSTERNHLLILLDQGKRRSVHTHELLFCDIPSVYEANQQQGLSLSLMAAAHEECVYPSGQRVLDQFMASQLSEKGKLVQDQIVSLIPRSSPMRDQLLDRCDAVTFKEATDLLSLYWSPMAAYAKAFEISQAWLEASSGNRTVLKNILKITDEFPSLRRRMVNAWVDRFGVRASDYAMLLEASADSDAFDLYRGVALDGTRQTSQVQKAAACLGSFASAMSREDHSLLSVQFVGGKIRKPDIDGDSDEVKRAWDLVNLYEAYNPLLPEEASTLTQKLLKNDRYQIHRIPFVDGKPLPNPRFKRNTFITDGLKDLKQWEAGKSFSRFMSAMGWEEAVLFYEELLLGAEGVMQHPDLFKQIEEIFLEGIHLMLEEKGVLLSRALQVKKGLQLLLKHQSAEVCGQIWARILAGIAQQQELGEIVREAVRPLGAAAGAKLMQAIHSLTRGVDTTLERATRLALDQTARFNLFQCLQFQGARGVEPFEVHDRYQMLGQGSVRAGMAGRGGAVEDSAYLLVHAAAADARIVEGIVQFIRELRDQGYYFPLSPSQFRDLVEATDSERLRGFQHHRDYRARYANNPDFPLHIPEIYEAYEDWARLELAQGSPYESLPIAEKIEVAAMTIGASMAQLLTLVEGQCLVNPEMHGGNVLYKNPMGSLVDCGLIEHVTLGDVEDFFEVQAGYSHQGIRGAAAAVLKKRNLNFEDLKADA